MDPGVGTFTRVARVPWLEHPSRLASNRLPAARGGESPRRQVASTRSEPQGAGGIYPSEPQAAGGIYPSEPQAGQGWAQAPLAGVTH